jgi:hypothetical protein
VLLFPLTPHVLARARVCVRVRVCVSITCVCVCVRARARNTWYRTVFSVAEVSGMDSHHASAVAALHVMDHSTRLGYGEVCGRGGVARVVFFVDACGRSSDPVLQVGWQGGL